MEHQRTLLCISTTGTTEACGRRSTSLQHLKLHYQSPTSRVSKVWPTAAAGRSTNIDSLIKFVYLQIGVAGLRVGTSSSAAMGILLSQY